MESERLINKDILEVNSLMFIVTYFLFVLTGITWVQGDATKLPFSDNSFDAYTISFGLRNVTNLDEVGCYNIIVTRL